ncbi:hypothetical protein EDC04DRAFT_1637280 [Pisolithus marmoratus]|nr:hypothetical protein EDC04DRAFT_1637280 [Pisolithus marmoratus]
MGVAVRTPRLFTAYSSRYFQVMMLILGSPFELFILSVFSFITALVVHFGIHAASFQCTVAILVFLPLIIFLGLYWLVTEPQEKQMICSWEATTITDAEAGGAEARSSEAFELRGDLQPFNPIRGAGGS